MGEKGNAASSPSIVSEAAGAAGGLAGVAANKTVEVGVEGAVGGLIERDDEKRADEAEPTEPTP